MGGSIVNCLDCGAFMYTGSKCPQCRPDVVEDAIAATLQPNKTERFSTTLKRAKSHEHAVMDWFQSKGFYVAKIPTYDDDQGDFFIWKTDGDGVKNIRTVDAKQAIEWQGPEFPFRKIYITAEKELHRDWMYIITNLDITHYVLIDMRKHAMTPLSVDETRNRRGGSQRSVGMCVDFVTIREL